MEPYFTVIIPYEPEPSRRTTWHPYEPTGPFSTLSRGAFTTADAADVWARAHLGRDARYEIKEVRP